MENKGLMALHHPRIKLAKVDISAKGKHDIAYMFFDDTKQYAAIEKELKRLEEIDNAMFLNNKKLKALEIISKAYGDYANHKISEYELIMTVGENTTY